MSLVRYVDSALEWRCLAAIMKHDNQSWIERLNVKLFSMERVRVFDAMLQAWLGHGTITYEGIRTFNEGRVPNELMIQVEAPNMVAMVEELVRLATKRTAANLSGVYGALAEQSNPTWDQIVQQVEELPLLTQTDSSLTTGARSVLNEIDQKRNGTYPFVRTGLGFMDRSWGGGLKRGAVCLYMGAPGSGKTALVTQIADNLAQGYVNTITGEHVVTPTLIISLEMSKDDLLLRMVANRGNIDYTELVAGTTDDATHAQTEAELAEIQQLPLYIVETDSSMTLTQIIGEIRRHVTLYGVGVVCVDYLQIIEHFKFGNENKDLGDISRMLKRVAKQLNITIILLSQITAQGASSKVRGSGEVAQHVDVIIEGVVEDDSSMPQTADERGYRHVTFVRHKNRYGSTGKTAVLFNGRHQRFEEPKS